MKLSLRLDKIANKIRANVIADIGTDHAYIPIFLKQNNKITRAIACDISRGSLEKANNNIIKYGLQNDIQTRLGDGLLVIEPEDFVEDIIIAGMGGMLMINILKKGLKTINEKTRLILQPQKDIDKVRRYIHSQELYIYDEEIFIDDDKYYNIIVAKKGNEDNKYTENEYLFGKLLINEKSEILKQYVQYQTQNILYVISKIDKNNSDILELQKKYNQYKEVLKCL